MTTESHANRAAVTFEDVTAVLGDAVVLDRASATVPAGSCTAIVGPNGAGKTTLLMALLGRIPFRGHIAFAGGASRPRIGYVPQRLDFDRGLPLTAREFLCLNWQRRPLWLGLAKNHRLRAEALLAAVDAGHLAGRRAGDLSGGELQRLLLALALGRDPELLILDEPTSGVDFQAEEKVYLLLERLRRERGFTQIMVSHDIPGVARHASHVIGLNRRVVFEGAPGLTVTRDSLADAFAPPWERFAEPAGPSAHSRKGACHARPVAHP